MNNPPDSPDTATGKMKAIKHFALHRIDGTELRVISDIETGVIAISEVEETVLCRYTQRPDWPHQVVTLFVLSNLGALQRQLSLRFGMDGLETGALPPGGIEALGLRPVVNLYDLSDPSACNVFVNQAAMSKEGYWGDRLAETALLAHEHGHPLAETGAVRASRRLSISFNLRYREPLTIDPASEAESQWRDKLLRLLRIMAEKLCLYAPREVFTNDIVLENDFGAALYHLDSINVANAVKAVESRPQLAASLANEPVLSNAGRAIFLVVADLKAHLDLAMEIASFWRQNQIAWASELERILERQVFSRLVPETWDAYGSLRNLYWRLNGEAAEADMVSFVRRVIEVLSSALSPYGVAIDSISEILES